MIVNRNAEGPAGLIVGVDPIYPSIPPWNSSSPRELSFQLNREKDSFDKEFAKWARCFLVAPLFARDNVQVWWNLSIQISL